MVEIARQLDASFVYLRPGKVPDVVGKHRSSFSLFPLRISPPIHRQQKPGEHMYVAPDRFLAAAAIA
jgi:hypothetical protein